MLSFFNPVNANTLKRVASSTRLQSVDSAVILYFHLFGKLPSRLDDLVQGNCLTDEELLDSWSRPYEYDVQDNTYTLTGHTADGRIDEALRIRRQLNPAAYSKTVTKLQN